MAEKKNRGTQRRQEILEKTLELVQEGGLSCVTTKKIAERVGFSEPAIYRYFRNKNELLLGLMDLLEGMLVDPAVTIKNKSIPPADRMLAIVQHHADLILKYNSLPVLLFAEASTSNDPAMIRRMKDLLKRYMAVIREVIRQGQESGEINKEMQADSLALMLMGVPESLAIIHRLSPKRVVEDNITTLLSFVVKQMKSKAGGK